MERKQPTRETLRLVAKLSKSSIAVDEVFSELLFAVKTLIMKNTWNLEYFNYFLNFKREFLRYVSTKDFKEMKMRFKKKSMEEISNYKQIEDGFSDDVKSDDVTSAIDEISMAAPQFGFNFDDELEELREIANELENVELQTGSRDYSDYDGSSSSTKYNEDDIESLFDSLRSEF